MKFATRNI